MNILRRIQKSFTNYVYDSSRDVKDRTFVLFSAYFIMAIVTAMIVGILLKEPASSTLFSFIMAVICILLMLYVVKNHREKGAKIVVAVLLVVVFQPLQFLTKGGVSAGDPFTLLLGTYYIVLILEGGLRVVMCIIDLIVLMSCWILAYVKPELITQYSRESDLIYSFCKYIITMIVLSAVIIFQTRIYRKEVRNSEKKTKELEELNRSQNRFFSSMSHEIRTPINTVLGLNEVILRQEDASEEIKKDARSIQGAGKMLLALINDILDISRIEAGRMEIVPVNYSVASLLSEIVNMFWLKTKEKGIAFNVDIDPEVPETLFGDEVRLKQILINLLNNAVKYTNEGSVTLHMECEFPDTGYVLLKISVSDTGIGIKPEALPTLFDAFQRHEEDKNRYIEGTGLGLSIVKQLVELMGGEITVNSVYSRGTDFTVTLRQGISSEKRIGELSISGGGSVVGSERFEHSFTAPAARILIVDDNDMNLQVEKKLLEGTEMTIDLARSGQEALFYTLKTHYDTIFMDHLMPDMDGIECFEKIRAQKDGLNVITPVIVLTANAGSDNIELYNNAGFDGYLLKPVSGAQLEDKLISHLPPEKVMGLEENENAGSALNTASGYLRKRAVAIACGSMNDLPLHVINELQISTIPSQVVTDKGIFADNIDLDSEELFRYMGDDLRPVETLPPKEEDYVNFFASVLRKAHHLIFITLTSSSSGEYENATKAAKAFDNVTIVNSEMLSSSMGFLAVIAAKLAKQNLPLDKILSELEIAKKHLNCSFIIKTTDVMARRNKIGPVMNVILTTLWLRPILRVRNDRMEVGKFLFGSEIKCYEKYIKYALPYRIVPDTSMIFVTYAGLEEEDLLWIEKKLLERVNFDRVIFQKASAGIASNCGAGSFGLLYMTKADHDYNLGPLFDSRDGLDFYQEDMMGKEHEEEPESVPEPKWYENLKGIDPGSGIKNSGTEATFRSVLQMFYESYGARAEELENYFGDRDWKNYTIKVHALKSSARLVGALDLSEEAFALEKAGKGSDIDYILANHPQLMTEYKILVDGLASEFGTTEDLPDIPQDVLIDAYAGLYEFAQAKDFELARMVLGSVKEYKLPAEDAARFEKIQNCLSGMDWDGIMDLLEKRANGGP
jgi:DegV family protein with EDD domain